MHKLKDVTRRSSLLLLAACFMASLGATILPTIVTADPFFTSEFANRSLALTSSSPGWAFTDGAGNSGPSSGAPAGSGANGKQTGEKFTFNTNTDYTSTSHAITAFTLEFCTTAAGACTAPGNGALNVGSQLANLDIHYSSPVPDTDFVIKQNTTDVTGTPSTGHWTMAVSQVSASGGTNATGTTSENSYITLICDSAAVPNACAPLHAAHGDTMEIDFNASTTNYITNPGTGAFFVRMADYSAKTPLDDTTLMDAGVTVANVVNLSIQITTKVLETMTFSVGVADPDSYGASDGVSSHGSCDNLLPVVPGSAAGTPDNALALGDSSLEYALTTQHSYDAYSLWRISSNSAYGASIYYAGDTLSSTEGASIAGIGTTKAPALAGSNQFGLAVNPDLPDPSTGASPGTGSYYDAHPLSAAYQTAYGTGHTADPASWLYPTLNGLTPQAPYDHGNGTIVDNGSGTAEFAFDPNANVSNFAGAPILVAQKASNIITCATGEMRYVASIAGNKPAGIYTTKINYIAAPEY